MLQHEVLKDVVIAPITRVYIHVDLRAQFGEMVHAMKIDLMLARLAIYFQWQYTHLPRLLIFFHIGTRFNELSLTLAEQAYFTRELLESQKLIHDHSYVVGPFARGQSFRLLLRFHLFFI